LEVCLVSNIIDYHSHNNNDILLYPCNPNCKVVNNKHKVDVLSKLKSSVKH